MTADYACIPESALTTLALLILKRAKLTLPVTNRRQAVAVIRGVKPAPPRNQPLNIRQPVPLCRACCQALPVGTLCDSTGQRHIECSKKEALK
jgi:hypothetical protein